MWDKLEEIILKIKKERRVAINSAHGCGKSWLMARIILWFFITNYPSKIIITAPTWEQVRSVLFGEIKAAINRSPILQDLIPKNNILDAEIKIAPDWFIKGISTTESVELRDFGSTKFQGFHSPNLLIVMDEAPGVDASIHIGVENLATGGNNKIVEIGNPTSPIGHFYNNCNNWANVHISAFDHPNIKENREVIPGCITTQWIEERKQDWGESSPLYIAKVLGQFPQEGEDTVIPLNWIQESVDYEVEPSDYNILGFDPARFGNDETVFAQLRNNEITFKGIYNKQDTMATAGRIVRWADTERFDIIAGDPIGIGAGIFDRIKEINQSFEYQKANKNIPIREVNFTEKSLDERFYNLRAEAYSFLADRLNPENPRKIKLPNDLKLHNQLASQRYIFNSRGKMLLESKEDLKKKGLDSPDRGDAVAIAVYSLKFLEMPRKLVEYMSDTEKEFMEKRKPKSVKSKIMKL